MDVDRCGRSSGNRSLKFGDFYAFDVPTMIHLNSATKKIQRKLSLPGALCLRHVDPPSQLRAPCLMALTAWMSQLCESWVGVCSRGAGSKCTDPE
jgi:hypothetical protein